MRKFLKFNLILILFLFTINLGVYIVLSDSPTSRFYNYFKVIDEINVNTNYSLLVTGDSHANAVWSHYKSDSILDFSFPGDSQIDIKNKISFLRKNNIKIGIHLYSIDAHILSSYRSHSNNNDISILFNDNINVLKIKRMMPLFFNSRTISDLKKYVNKSKIDKEFGTFSIDEKYMLKRGKSQFINKIFSIDLFNILKGNIQYSSDLGQKVIAIRYPLYNKYKQLIDTTESYNQAVNIENKLILQKQIPLIDMSNYIDNINYFKNEDHVNEKGALIVRNRIMEFTQLNN